MFDKLVESASTGAELRPRRRIFAATLLFVSVVFATAVVASIYAANFDLGNESFDIAELLTPIAETEPQPEPVRQQPQNNQVNQSQQTTRVMNIPRIEESPIVPETISTARSPYLTRPVGLYDINPRGFDTNGPPADTLVGNENVGQPSGSNVQSTVNDEPKEKEPPPVPPVVKNRAPTSGGVMTGKATSLPQPVYSAAAKAVGAQGIVTVQITVDESGKVISAKALDGNALLRPSAVAAAWKAKFDPTTLSKIPVKVTGIITYNFKR